MIEVLDLFSAAAGGWSLGMHRAGFSTIAACESVAWRRALYAENNPNVRLYDDVRTLTADRLRDDLGRLPAVVVGSPPCQDISSANTKGRGVEGERSGLYFEAIRIIGEVRPRWFALENSANLRTRGADAVIAALEAIGYACWAVVVRAGDDPRGAGAGVGANHERERCWIIGCDLEQVAEPDGIGRHEGRGRGRRGLDLSVSQDLGDASRIRCASRSGSAMGAGRADERHQSAGDAQHTACVGHEGRRPRRHGADGHHAPYPQPSERDTPDPDQARQARQARQAHGCMVASVRQEKIADDGRCVGWRDDEPGVGQVAVCSPDRGDACGGRPLWSLADLADHLRLDDGLSARLAGARIHVGDGKGQSGASAIVEAFGDAVIPQIPEGIGRAILRVETAMSVLLAA